MKYSLKYPQSNRWSFSSISLKLFGVISWLGTYVPVTILWQSFTAYTTFSTWTSRRHSGWIPQALPGSNGVSLHHALWELFDLPSSNKCDRCVLSTFRGLSLVDIVTKVFTNILLRQFWLVYGKRTHLSRYGLQKGSGWTDKIATSHCVLKQWWNIWQWFVFDSFRLDGQFLPTKNDASVFRTKSGLRFWYCKGDNGSSAISADVNQES